MLHNLAFLLYLSIAKCADVKIEYSRRAIAESRNVTRSQPPTPTALSSTWCPNDPIVCSHFIHAANGLIDFLCFSPLLVTTTIPLNAYKKPAISLGEMGHPFALCIDFSR